jgi:hypothetical protein
MEQLAKIRRLPPVSMWRSIQTVWVPSSAANNASWAACLLMTFVRYVPEMASEPEALSAFAAAISF